MVGSATLLIATYVPSAAVGGLSPRDEDRFLFIPIAGPWVDLANRDCVARQCTNEDVNKALIIGSGVLQGIGALGVLSSFFVPERTVTYTAKAKPKPFVAVAPTTVGRSGYGVGAVGSFF
jgi:hypothetical protein